MKIKVGDKIHNSIEQPLMVILNEQDKKNIADMHPDCTKYACFPDTFGIKEEMFEWMEKSNIIYL